MKVKVDFYRTDPDYIRLDKSAVQDLYKFYFGAGIKSVIHLNKFYRAKQSLEFVRMYAKRGGRLFARFMGIYANEVRGYNPLAGRVIGE
jgi:hypothetical protein